MNKGGYEIKLTQFEGPLGKLLELIETRKLEVTRVSLAEVTHDFFKYLETLEHVAPQVLADFVSVAAKLILIKSHALIPNLTLEPEEEKEIADLEHRLHLYQEFKRAEEFIKKRWGVNVAFSRPLLARIPAGFYLTQRLSPEQIAAVMQGLYEQIAVILQKHESAQVKLVNFEEKVKELLERVDKTVNASFNEITSNKQRAEIVVLFLVILHLLKDSLITIHQENPFADITIGKTNRET